MGRKRSSNCGDCGKAKNNNDFHKASHSWDGLYSYCKDCCSLRYKRIYKKTKDKYLAGRRKHYHNNLEKQHKKGTEYYKENKSKVLARMKKRYWSDPERLNKQRKKNHVRRARCNGSMGFTNKKEWEKILSIYGEKCLCCGSEENIVADHIIPLCKEGENKADNIQPLCRSCNSKKHTKVIDYRYAK